MYRLNQVIDNYIEEFEIKNMNELLLHEKCSSIILDYLIKFQIPKYRKKYTFEQAFELSRDFLATISKEYGKYLTRRKNEDAFIVDYGQLSINPTSSSYIIDGKPMIHIVFSDSVRCSYSVTHETIHDMTFLEEDNTTRNIFCEVPAIYAEFLQDKYLENIGHIDSCVWQRERINIIQYKALCMSLEIELMRKFLEKGYLNNQDVENIFKMYNYDKNMLKHYGIIQDKQQLFWVQDQRHIWGFLIAAYMMDCENKNPTNYRLFLELNEMMNEYDENQFLHYLNLDRTSDSSVFDLTEESYQKLKTGYVNYLRNIR